MNTSPFTSEEEILLKSLNNRVLNQLPNLKQFKKCIITGPAVAELSVISNLGGIDNTFIIFAPDKTILSELNVELWTAYSMHPRPFERGYKFLNNKTYMGWFTLEYIDIIAEDVLVYDNSFNQNKNIIISTHDPEEYVKYFKYHPIYCLNGKCFVNRHRLDEAIRYCGKCRP